MTLESGLGPVRTFAAAVGAAALVGCGGSDDTATEKPTPAATKAQTAVVPDELVGTWTRRIPRRANSYYPPGKFTMKLLRDGSAEMFNPSADPADDCVAQSGCELLTFEARGGKLIVGEIFTCPGPGEYSYEIRGDELTTKRVGDDCTRARPQLFDGATWRRQS